MNFFFIPATANFWAQFWPALASGVLGSALTGLVVGLVLERARKSSERRLAYEHAVDELVRFMSEIHPLAAEHNPIIIGPAVQAEPPASRTIFPLVNQSPFDRWRRALGDHPVFEAIAAYQRSREIYLSHALQIDRDSRAVIRKHNAADDTDVINDSEDLAYLVATGLGVSPSEAMRWIGMPGAARRFTAMAAAAEQAGLTQRMRDIRQSLVDSVSALAVCTAPEIRQALTEQGQFSARPAGPARLN